MRNTSLLGISVLILAGMPAPGLAGKETLILQVGARADSRDTILDTVVMRVDYDAPPGVPAREGRWEDHEKDSVWVQMDSIYDPEMSAYTPYESKRIRYVHNFQVVKDGLEGIGNDYISYNTVLGQPAQYIASVSFSFAGDTSETWTWDPNHFRENLYLEPGLIRGFLPTGQYGEVFRSVGDETLGPNRWARLISRQAGWTEDSPAPVLAPPTPMGFRMGGWLRTHGTTRSLRVPAGASALRIFDAQGRLYWEKPPAARQQDIEVPGSLPSIPLRYLWMGGPLRQAAPHPQTVTDTRR